MIRHLSFVLLLVAFCPALVGAGKVKSEIIVSAAASFMDVMLETASLFEKENPDLDLVLNFGSSGKLRVQIVNGAPADLFISASSADMNALEHSSLTVEESRRTLAGNSLVLVKSVRVGKTIRNSKDLEWPSVTRVAMGNPVTVPAGRYAREVLERRGLYKKLAKKLIFTETVRQVLDYVARGEVDAGFVFVTDALTEPKAVITEHIPGDEHERIAYPAAALKNGRNLDGAGKLLEFLSSKKGKNILKRYGFK